MKVTRITQAEADALARRDRNRILGLAVLAVLVGGSYLYTSMDARKDREADSAAPDGATAEVDEFVTVVPFDQPEVLELILDGTPVEQQLLETDPLEVVFNYAQLQTSSTFEALGQTELGAAEVKGLLEAPADHRLDAFIGRGEVITASERRSDSGRSDWMGTLVGHEGQIVHFLVANAPLRANGSREIRQGDYLRIDGLFHAIYRTPVEMGEGPVDATAPLILGPSAIPSTPEMNLAIAEAAPTLGSVQDDTIGQIYDPELFEMAQWELMGRAKLMGDQINWDEVPELNTETLAALYADGAAYRGEPYRLPVSINLDTYSVRVQDNPLRLDRMTIGWVGNNGWNKPVKAIKWVGPFVRQDMMRNDLDDNHRYVVGKGFFFRTHVFNNNDAQPVRAPVFVMHEIEVFEPKVDWTLGPVTYGILGLTGGIVVAIFLLLRADRKKSARLYEEMVERRRMRRKRESATPA